MHLQSLSRDEISSPQNSLDFVLVCNLYKLAYNQQMSFFSSLLFIFLIFTNRFIQYICPPLCLQKNKVVQVCFLSFRIILLFQLVLLMLSPISKTQDGEKSDSSTWTSVRDALNIALIQSKICNQKYMFGSGLPHQNKGSSSNDSYNYRNQSNQHDNRY